MRSLKTISWITLAVVVLMAGVSAFMTKKYSAKAEATMDCPARVTRNIINNLGLAKKWLWLPGIDTAYSTSCVGVLKGTGASCDYNSSLPASGVIRILNSTPDSSSLADELNEGNTTFYKYRITQDQVPLSALHIVQNCVHASFHWHIYQIPPHSSPCSRPG